MKFAGIIAEYDPFHNGHAWQLAQAKALGAEHVAVAMSCGLTQRGSLRVQAALQCGADLIFALPAPCACAGAEAFARAGVRILAAAGCDALVFGAETPDAALLMEAARVLCSAAYRTELKQQLAAGARSFAAARQAAVEALCPGTALAALLDKPNNNLAVEYCKAILEQEAPMTPVPLPRVGAGHGQALAESGHAQFASASALRALWAEQGADALAPYVPEKALELYKKAEIDGTYTDCTAAGRCQLTLLRAACARPEPFAAVRGVSEGLDHRLEQAGKNLSGGQKQRVSIARAVLKNAPIYLFDDSFSALDFMTEANLRRALAEKAAGRTQIVVTQRVTSAMSSDQIFVMDGGRLVDSGTHRELLERCKVYREIYLSQTGGERR